MHKQYFKINVKAIHFFCSCCLYRKKYSNRRELNIMSKNKQCKRFNHYGYTLFTSACTFVSFASLLDVKLMIWNGIDCWKLYISIFMLNYVTVNVPDRHTWWVWFRHGFFQVSKDFKGPHYFFQSINMLN